MRTSTSMYRCTVLKVHYCTVHTVRVYEYITVRVCGIVEYVVLLCRCVMWLVFGTKYTKPGLLLPYGYVRRDDPGL